MRSRIKKEKSILFISGLDPSGNAGLLADVQIAQRLGFKAAACVTALTAQNNQNFFKTQIVALENFKNILRSLQPLQQFSAIKIGMLGNAAIVNALVKALNNYRGTIVLDPLNQSSTGGILLSQSGQKALIKNLLPLVTLWTPNLIEARQYLGLSPLSRLSSLDLALALYNKYGVPVYLKGGHLKGPPTDIYIDKGIELMLKQKRLPKKIRGTGCRLASFLACRRVDGILTKNRLVKIRQDFQQLLKTIS